MSRKYTAADFANARFAEHPDGRRAVRTSTPVAPWIMEMRTGPAHCAKDSEMALDGWVPVLTKPTITESRFMELVEVCSFADGPASYREFCRLAGIEIVPDPEPTNTERLQQLYDNWSQSKYNPPFGEWADSIGVTAPKESN